MDCHKKWERGVNADDLYDFHMNMAYIKRVLAERIALHSGQDVDQIQTDSERDRWFTAEEAKDYGLCDHVIVKRGEII